MCPCFAVLNKGRFDFDSLDILFCSLILPYFEVRGISSVTRTKPLYVSEKREIKLIDKGDERKHSNRLLIRSHMMTFND